MVTLFLRYHLVRFIRYFRVSPFARIFTAIVFIAVLGAVAVGIYFFLTSSLKVIVLDQLLRRALPLYLYELFFAIVSYLVLASGMVAGLFSLFRRPYDTWIAASPAFRKIPFVSYVRLFISSLWPLIVIAVPGLLAVRSVFGMSGQGLFLSLLASVLLVALLVLLAETIVIGFAALLYFFSRITRSHLLTLGKLAVLALSLLVFLMYFLWDKTVNLDVLKLFRIDKVQGIAAIEPILEQFTNFPSHHVASAVFLISEDNLQSAYGNLRTLALWTAALFLALLLLGRAYLPLWQVLQEGHFEAQPVYRLREGQERPFPRYFQGPLGAIFEKEALLIRREVKNLMWLGFLGLLWFAQTAVNVFIRRNLTRYEATHADALELLQALQVLTVVYFVGAFVLRFAFPAFSVERKTAWIIGSAPLDLGKVFLAKFYFFSALFVILALTVGLINSWILSLPLPVAGLFLIFVGTVVIVLVALGLGLGALFPSFETDDPQVLSTSLPGLVFVVLALAYGALGAFLLYQFLIGGTLTYVLLFLTFSWLVVFALLAISRKSLQHFEFADARS